MATAEVFNNGGSQAVRIPKEYRFDTEEVFINRIGETVLLTPKKDLAYMYDQGIQLLTDDFMEECLPESIPSVREEL